MDAQEPQPVTPEIASCETTLETTTDAISKTSPDATPAELTPAAYAALIQTAREANDQVLRKLLPFCRKGREPLLYNVTKVTGEPKHVLRFPPKEVEEEEIKGPTVFLAGSIEQGGAVEWQEEFTRRLHDVECTIFNPRRRDWNSNLKQSKDDEQFKGQVEWELASQERADIIAMYIDPLTMSPISLLELGLFSSKRNAKGDPKLVVCCPESFYRYGNVELTCDKYHIDKVTHFDDLVAKVETRIQALTEWKKEQTQQTETKGKKKEDSEGKQEQGQGPEPELKQDQE